jgi:hypothetical protein
MCDKMNRAKFYDMNPDFPSLWKAWFTRWGATEYPFENKSVRDVANQWSAMVDRIEKWLGERGFELLNREETLVFCEPYSFQIRETGFEDNRVGILQIDRDVHDEHWEVTLIFEEGL